MINPSNIIRAMTIEDYDGIYKLWAETEGMCLRGVDDSYERINKFIKKNPETCFVAIDEKNKIIGSVLCGNDGRRGYIYHLAVHKNYRKMGIGSNLVNEAVYALRDLGISKAVLLVLRTNNEGNEFWEKMGYYERNDVIYRDMILDDKNI